MKLVLLLQHLNLQPEPSVLLALVVEFPFSFPSLCPKLLNLRAHKLQLTLIFIGEWHRLSFVTIKMMRPLLKAPVLLLERMQLFLKSFNFLLRLCSQPLFALQTFPQMFLLLLGRTRPRSSRRSGRQAAFAMLFLLLLLLLLGRTRPQSSGRNGQAACW